MNRMRILAERAMLDAARLSGAARWARARSHPFGAIFTLHHVSPSPAAAFAPNDHLRVGPAFLASLIQVLGARGCEFVSLAEAVLRIAEPQARDRFFVAFTLDDGFADNAENAAPVFRAAGVPYAVFVTPGFADGSVLPWWEAVEAIVRARTVIHGLPGGASEADSPSAKRRAVEALCAHLQGGCSEAERDGEVRRLATLNGLAPAGLAPPLLDWAGLAALSADPLCTIGAHTMTHPRLARLTPEAALAEMAGSRLTIGRMLGTAPPAFFAYPYGSACACGPREFALAREAGFSAAFTTRLHALTARTARNLHALPRLSLNGYYQKPRYVEVMISGLPGRWKHRRAGGLES